MGRSSQRSISVQSLESRQLLAADVIASADVPAGYYAQDDLIDVPVTIKNRGNSKADYPYAVLVTLSKDKKIGNADDIEAFTSTVSLAQTPGKSETQKLVASVQPSWPAGDYYVATRADVYGIIQESNEDNNVTWSEKRIVRIVTDRLTDNHITGTAGNDDISVQEHWANNVVTVNGVSKYFDNMSIKDLFIDAGAGNDKIYAATDRVYTNLKITGAGGNDTIVGGDGNDELSGANGKDKVWGGEGQDYLLGGAQNDTLDGEAGFDTLSGAGGNDRLISLSGREQLFGGAGNDTIIARDTQSNFDNDPDTISGGAGIDKCQYDASDVKTGIESILN